MKKQTRILKNGSDRAAVSQPKSARNRAGVHSDFPLPCLALFPAGNDGGAEEMIDLSKADYAALKWATRGGSDVLKFMAKAALEKAAVGPQPKTGSTAGQSCQRAHADAGNNSRPYNPESDHPSCLCIFDRSTEEMVSKIPLSEDEFYFLLASCGTNGGSVEQFIAEAIGEKLSPRIEAAAMLGTAAESCLKHASRPSVSTILPAALQG